MTVSTVVQHFITQDSDTLKLLKLTERVARSDISVLIQGESGTGKEVLAKILHQSSTRNKAPLVSINCGAIQDSLFLSELFGHEKGAFTGAHTLKRGLVEQANGGILFLDEIGEMGMEAQAKLLRFLEQGEIYRVGGKNPIRVDVRILSATNRNLLQQVKKGQFREDLYFRINTILLRIAPLRHRLGDIRLLLRMFLNGGAESWEPYEISKDGLALLERYPWPGNVRELKNLTERLKVVSDGFKVNAEEVKKVLPPEELFFTPEEASRESFCLREVEKSHIIKVLSYFKGNKTQAARAMGITVKTLYNKLSEFERPPRERSPFWSERFSSRQNN